MVLIPFLPYVDIYLKVEEHQEHEGEDADGDEAEPVERDRVGGVLSELGHVEVGSGMGGRRSSMSPRTLRKRSSCIQGEFLLLHLHRSCERLIPQPCP